VDKLKCSICKNEMKLVEGTWECEMCGEVREYIDNMLPKNKSRIEEISELVYDILAKYGEKKYDISGIEDKQDIAWDIATEIYNKYKK